MKITAISDLHGRFPGVDPCDLLIVGGDICPDGFGGRWAQYHPDLQLEWFKTEFVPWAQSKAKHVMVTWGNHDFCGHLLPRGSFGNLSIFTDERAQLILGPPTHQKVKLWFTPWSNQFMNWAWMKRHDELAAVYAQIPWGLDILVSHQPPYGCGDRYPNAGTGEMEHIGSSELLYAIEQKKPKVVICGHLHGGHGVYNLGETTVYNVSIVNEAYRPVYPPTDIQLTYSA